MITDVSINVIQSVVSGVSNMSVREMIMEDGLKTARKREKVVSRMVSMCLTKKYTTHTLAYIGLRHGDRDHATVLYAVKTVNNLLDTKNKEAIMIYSKSEANLRRIMNKRKRISDSIRTKAKLLPVKQKLIIVKSFLKNHVPLEQREYVLNNYLTKCPYCNHEHNTQALPREMQKGNKR